MEYQTGGPPILSRRYRTDLLRAAFATLQIIEPSEYEADLNEGTQLAGRSALVGLLARKP